MTSRGLGFLPDDPRLVELELYTRPAEALVGGDAGVSETLPLAWSNLAHVKQLPDQGLTQSCVGQAAATALETLSHLHGRPIARPSALAIYTYARLIARPHQPLVDVGCSPSAALQGMRDRGLVAESRWSLQEHDVDEAMPVDVDQHALDALLGEHHRAAPGRGIAERLRLAIHQGHVPIYAQDVDQSFMSYDGSAVFRDLSSGIRGRHMQAIVGYGPDWFLVAGSWGRDWGRDGFALVADEFMESGACDSFIFLTLAPKQVT